MWFLSKQEKKEAEAESKTWLGLCKSCKSVNSVWEVGGVRYKAAGKFHARVKCPRCSKKSTHMFQKVGLK